MTHLEQPSGQPASWRAPIVRSAECLRAVDYCLAFHACAEADFERCGIGAAWAAGLRQGSARLEELEEQRAEAALNIAVAQDHRRALLREARFLWRALALAAREARLAAPLLPRRMPEAEAPLCEALRLALHAASGQQEAEALARFGFREEERRGLADLLAQVADLGADIAAEERRRKAATAAILAVRGALLRDLGRFSRLAALLLPPPLARTVQMARLLSRRSG